MSHLELTVLDRLGVIAVVLDPRGGIAAWTRAFADASPCAHDELRGRLLWELAEPDPAPLRRALTEVAADRRPRRVDAAMISRSGERRLLAWSCAMVPDEAGGEALAAWAADITATLGPVDHALETHSQVLMSMAEAVSFMDANGIIHFTNPAHDAMFGYARGEMIGKHVSVFNDAAPEDNARIVDGVLRALAEHPRMQREFRCRRKDGSVFYSRAHLSTLQHPGELRWVVVQEDITERRRIEQALREEDARKNEFLAALSHELRNPLAPIRNSLALLDRAAPDSEQARRARAVLERQVDHLVRLVDDLLDVTRITRGKVDLHRERLELGELARRTIDDHASGFEARGIALELKLAAEPLWLIADATRLVQVIGNLLTNAMKFTPRGGRVEVTLARDRDAAVLRVRDSGIGIDHDVLPQLFVPFVQAHQTLDRTSGGLGLGLAIVKGLVELHGGSVAAASEGPGKGAELMVRLPLVPAPERLAHPAEARTGSGRRVLVIEDNLDAADTLRELLELSGHEVRVAADGPTGVATAHAFHPEVVFCDLGLPGMSGYEVARAIRNDGDVSDAVLVALSGYALPEDRELSAEAGFTYHIAKPATLDELEQVIGAAPHTHVH
jgi:two-component system CheB/CheR fusion protein